MKSKSWLILLAGLGVILLASSVGLTTASVFDQETSSGNAFEAWTSILWKQTSQPDFEAGVLNNVDTSSSAGDVTLASQLLDSGINWFLNSDSKVYEPTIGSWQDVDISADADIPDGATGLVLEIVNESADTDYIGQVRAKGSTDNRTAGAKINKSTQIMAFVKLDANREFQAYRDDAAIKFYVRGYTDNDVTFFTNWSDVAGGHTAYTIYTVDLSGNGVPGNSIAILELYDHGTSTYSGLKFRRNGDTDWQLYAGSGFQHGHQYIMIGVDANSKFQHYKSNNDYANFYLVGYLENRGTWKATPSGDVSGSTTGSWVDRDVTSNTSNNADLAMIRVTCGWVSTQPKKVDFRKNGSSDDQYTYGEHWYQLPSSSIFYVVGLDSTQIFEAKIEATAINIHVLGYTEPGAAYVSSGTIASQVLDTGVAGARWDALFWDETLQSNTDITFEVRASDTPFAKDDTTPSWISVGGDPPVTSGLPSGRYMQWRATLTTSDTSKTPTLHEVRVYHY